MTRLDWERARRRRGRRVLLDQVEDVGRAARGISNDQARELARLQRQLGRPYSGRGLTMREAAVLIDVLSREAALRAAGRLSGAREGQRS